MPFLPQMLISSWQIPADDQRGEHARQDADDQRDGKVLMEPVPKNSTMPAISVVMLESRMTTKALVKEACSDARRVLPPGPPPLEPPKDQHVGVHRHADT